MTTFQDVFYLASLVEYIARKTLNRRSTIVKAIGKGGIIHLLSVACVNHCLSMEQVAAEVIEEYQIGIGTYDTVSRCKFKVPGYKAIGKVYARLIQDTADTDRYAEAFYEVFTSGIEDKISDFNSSFYFAPRSEVVAYYRELTK